MKYIFIITISLILASCGPSSEEKKDIAAVTCSIMGETRDIDAAVRVEKMNDARKEIGREPFLEGDSVIQEAFEYGLCQELVLNENYKEALKPLKDAWEAGAEDRTPSIKEEFHENGQLKSRINYQSKNDGGKEHGLTEFYYENGQLRSKGNNKDGKWHGLIEVYYENGQLRAKENFKDGKWHGLQEHYYEDGQLDMKMFCNSDKYDEDTDMSYCEPQ